MSRVGRACEDVAEITGLAREQSKITEKLNRFNRIINLTIPVPSVLIQIRLHRLAPNLPPTVHTQITLNLPSNVLLLTLLKLPPL